MRSRETETDAFNLDSLLDTLTCVVGVLIIVMAITQLVVLKTARALTLLPRTAAEVELKQNEADEIRAALDEITDRWGVLQVSLPEQDATVEELTQRLASLNSELPNPVDVEVRLDAARNERINAAEELAVWEARIMFARQENDRLQSDIGSRRPAREIRLPERRTVNVPLDPVHFVVKGGRVYHWDAPNLAKEFSESVEVASKSFTSSMSTSSRISRIVSYLEENNVGDSSFRLKIRPVRSSGKLRGLMLTSVPRQTGDAAETAEQIARRTSNFRRTIGRIDSSKQYAAFFVYADSFETYLEAREIAENEHAVTGTTNTQLGASWRAYAMDEEVSEFWDISNQSSGGQKARDEIDYY